MKSWLIAWFCHCPLSHSYFIITFSIFPSYYCSTHDFCEYFRTNYFQVKKEVLAAGKMRVPHCDTKLSVYRNVVKLCARSSKRQECLMFIECLTVLRANLEVCSSFVFISVPEGLKFPLPPPQFLL